MTWENLIKAFQFVPGTARPRILLTAWEAFLGVICWAGGYWWGVWGLGGLLVAFILHEVGFKAWVTKVVGILDAEDGDQVGFHWRAILTLERWTGPVR